MKKIYIFAFFILSFSNIFAQNKNSQSQIDSFRAYYNEQIGKIFNLINQNLPPKINAASFYNSTKFADFKKFYKKEYKNKNIRTSEIDFDALVIYYDYLSKEYPNLIDETQFDKLKKLNTKKKEKFIKSFAITYNYIKSDTSNYKNSYAYTKLLYEFSLFSNNMKRTKDINMLTELKDVNSLFSDALVLIENNEDLSSDFLTEIYESLIKLGQVIEIKKNSTNYYKSELLYIWLLNEL